MKYIRTQDGIAEDAGTDALGLRCVHYKRYKVVLSQEDDVIVKEADTIEELCDCYIYVDNLNPEYPPQIYYDYQKLHFEHHYEEELGIDTKMCELYIAIWIKDKNGSPTLKCIGQKKKEYGEFELL